MVEDAIARGAAAEAVDLRRAWFERFPNSSAFAALRKTAESVGAWEDERPAAEKRLAERDPQGFVRYLLADDRGDEAWDFAAPLIDPAEAPDVWLNLCEHRAKTSPSDTLPIYRTIVQQTLVVTDKRNYRMAADILKKMRDAADAAGAAGEFADFLAQVVEENRRRPTCIEVFRKAKLIPRV